MNKKQMKKVVILYKYLLQYRVDFFNQLKDKLYEHDIELILIYGKLKNSESKKADEIDLPWANFRENKILKINKYSLIWQPSLDEIKNCDLVIVEQANILLVNYVLIILRRFLKFKFAYWGHGANLQESHNALTNKFRYLFISQCDHWFAYTNSVKTFLLNKNVSDDIITVVNNAIDTKTIRQQHVECSDKRIVAIKNDLGIEGDNIAIYSGGLYHLKRIDFMIKAGKKISEEIKNFNLIVIGAGPDDYIVKNAAQEYSWLHYVGPKFGDDRVAYFKVASVFLLPGGVGLAILDAFATETPMITTKNKLHGPEIEYLENGKNGIVTNNSLEEYADNVIELLGNKNRITELKKGCLASFELYTTEKMVENFTNGILKCLAD